ncbi:MAG: GNAT family N-acetyltransferase, partial [Actinomycetota bacterium]|nr:GNAT family N-acetyltransferase [Actinomycetota bacterium]
MSSTDLPQLDGVVWRPLTPGDAEAMADLHNACFEVDHTFRMTPGEMSDEFDRFGEHAETDSIGAFTAEGELLALGWCGVPESAKTENRAFAWLLVHPRIRGTVEDALVDWIESAAIDRLRTFDDGLPAAMYRYDVYDTMLDEIALFERHGFEKARYFTENLRDLSEPIDEVPLDGGLDARVWIDDIAEDALTVHNAAFTDHWGSQPIASNLWATFHANEFFQPQMSRVVYDGAVPVAYMQCSRYPHDWEDRGRTEAWIEGIGTIKSHRGRGIASALITMAMLAFRSDGMEYAILGVDSENRTGANRIYERLGFKAERRSIA